MAKLFPSPRVRFLVTLHKFTNVHIADSALKVRLGATVMHGAHISRSGAKPSQLNPGFYHRVGVRSAAEAVACQVCGRRPVDLRTKSARI